LVDFTNDDLSLSIKQRKKGRTQNHMVDSRSYSAQARELERRETAALDLSLIDPLLREVVAATKRSTWLRTEFSCSGFPADHTLESEDTERRWGSYTCGRMYIAYACSRRYVRRVIRVAIAQAHRKLDISLHLHCSGGESAAGPELAQFAVAAFYDPGEPLETEAALGIFKGVAELATSASRGAVKSSVQKISGRGPQANRPARAHRAVTRS
ncbi:MAG TPA: hypothetical protein VHY56_09315, partial [Candidatus Binataceae bacterium]|nr:hypothetical protein [Candidatus Binataceae bacterium]